MNAGEIQGRVKALLGDTAGAEIRDSDLLNWISDGAVEIARRTNATQAAATTSTVIGTAAYTIASFATDILRLRSVMYDGSVLQAMSMEEADTFLADRERSGQSNGTPQMYWVWADQINLWPPPDAVKTLKIFYTKRPQAVGSGTDVPGIPLQMHGDLVDYVYTQALRTTGARDDAQRERSDWESRTREAAADADWPQRGSYPHISVSLDDTGWYG